MNLSPPPPSSFHLPFHPSSSTSFPVLAIAIIGILATAFLLVSYYIFVIKCCLNWHRIDVLHRFSSRRRPPNDAASYSSSPPNDAPKGLDEAIIRSIPVIKFRKLSKQERENETADYSYECAVCLSEFEEGERLRVIPICCHAFHIDCIDVWLQTNANCPLCRSGISPSSILHNGNIIPRYPPSPPRRRSDNFSGNEDDYVVIEIQGNNLVSANPPLEEELGERGERNKKQKRKKLNHGWSMGDECIDDMREKVEQPIRRSVSMDLSAAAAREFCLEIQEIEQQQCCSGNNKVSEISCCSSSSISEDCSSNSSKVRRSIFSFGYGRGTKGSVQPLRLDL